MRNAVLVAASLMAAGLLAGCGGGADRSTTTATRPTAEPSPTLVSFKRWAGSDPEEVQRVVRTMNRIVDDHAF